MSLSGGFLPTTGNIVSPTSTGVGGNSSSVIWPPVTIVPTTTTHTLGGYIYPMAPTFTPKLAPAVDAQMLLFPPPPEPIDKDKEFLRHQTGKYPVSRAMMRELIERAKKRYAPLRGATPSQAAEDLLAVQKMVESPDRTVAQVQVGEMSESRAREIVNTWKAALNKNVEEGQKDEPMSLDEIKVGSRVWSKSTGKGPYVVLAPTARVLVGTDKEKTSTHGWYVRDQKGRDTALPLGDASLMKPVFEAKFPMLKAMGFYFFLIAAIIGLPMGIVLFTVMVVREIL